MGFSIPFLARGLMWSGFSGQVPSLTLGRGTAPEKGITTQHTAKWQRVPGLAVLYGPREACQVRALAEGGNGNSLATPLTAWLAIQKNETKTLALSWVLEA